MDAGEEGNTVTNNPVIMGVGNGGMAVEQEILPANGYSIIRDQPAPHLELRDHDQYRKELEEEHTKSKETEDSYSKLRLEVIPVKTYFGSVKISKEDSFQLLYNANTASGTNTHNRVSP